MEPTAKRQRTEQSSPKALDFSKPGDAMAIVQEIFAPQSTADPNTLAGRAHAVVSKARQDPLQLAQLLKKIPHYNLMSQCLQVRPERVLETTGAIGLSLFCQNRKVIDFEQYLDRHEGQLPEGTLSALTEIPQLKRLVLSGHRRNSGQLPPALRELVSQQNPGGGINLMFSLEPLTQLQTVDLSGHVLRDIDLHSLTSTLTTLKLNHCRGLTPRCFDSLKNMRELKTLEAICCETIWANSAELKHLTQLRTLSIGSSTRVAAPQLPLNLQSLELYVLRDACYGKTLASLTLPESIRVFRIGLDNPGRIDKQGIAWLRSQKSSFLGLDVLSELPHDWQAIDGASYALAGAVWHGRKGQIREQSRALDRSWRPHRSVTNYLIAGGDTPSSSGGKEEV